MALQFLYTFLVIAVFTIFCGAIDSSKPFDNTESTRYKVYNIVWNIGLVGFIVSLICAIWGL